MGNRFCSLGLRQCRQAGGTAAAAAGEQRASRYEGRGIQSGLRIYSSLYYFLIQVSIHVECST